MAAIPTDRMPDSTAALLVEGYEFVSNRCRRLDTDVFSTRLYLQPTICMRGRPAAELFYGSSGRFTRQGAAPRRMRKTLFGEGGVQGMDGRAHEHRKQMFLDVVGPDRVGDLVAAVEGAWRRRMPAWRRAGQVVLYEEVGAILTEAVHDWAGVPLDEAEVATHRDQLHGMIVGGGGLGPNYLRGRIDRLRAERRAQRLVSDVRDGRLSPPAGSALHVIATHRTLDGGQLDVDTAAVELLNVLRPTVAVDRFVTLIALALHEHPAWRSRLRGADDAQLERFVHEVRRHYPFFPFAAARTARTFEWNGYRFDRGRRVLLDLYATNHDPRVWSSPERFDPERFVDWDGDAFGLVPQGGGEHHTAHRCAGEWATIALMTLATRLLVDGLEYRVPQQDLRLQRGKIPALPTSGFVIEVIEAAD